MHLNQDKKVIKQKKIIFKKWKEKKEKELREKKREKMQQEYETKSKSKHSNINKLNNKGFTIGPYTDAGALKEIQRFVAEKCTEDDDEEEGIVNDNENEGEEGYGDMSPEQIEQLKKLQQMQQMQINPYLNNNNINVNEQHVEKNKVNKDEIDKFERLHQEDDEDNNNISI